MEFNRSCVCVVEYKANNGYLYKVGEEYRVYKTRKHYHPMSGEGMYHEVVTKKGYWLGYILVSEFDKHFIFDEDVLLGINKVFNDIMDGIS